MEKESERRIHKKGFKAVEVAIYYGIGVKTPPLLLIIQTH